MKYSCFIKNKLIILSAICLSGLNCASAMGKRVNKVIELSVFPTREEFKFVSNAEKADDENKLSEKKNFNFDELYNLLKKIEEQSKIEDSKKSTNDKTFSSIEDWKNYLEKNALLSNPNDKLSVNNKSSFEELLFKKKNSNNFFWNKIQIW